MIIALILPLFGDILTSHPALEDLLSLSAGSLDILSRYQSLADRLHDDFEDIFIAYIAIA